ncbi:MAG: amidase family protein, partial [Thermoproteota archaeon]
MNLAISALDYIDAIKNERFTIEEFVSETFDQIKKVDGKLHAYLSLNDKALDQAKELDKKRKAKEKIGSCMGMPIAIKDNICVKDTKTTCASKMLEKYVAPFDATVITRLRKQEA